MMMASHVNDTYGFITAHIGGLLVVSFLNADILFLTPPPEEGGGGGGWGGGVGVVVGADGGEEGRKAMEV